MGATTRPKAAAALLFLLSLSLALSSALAPPAKIFAPIGPATAVVPHPARSRRCAAPIRIRSRWMTTALASPLSSSVTLLSSSLSRPDALTDVGYSSPRSEARGDRYGPENNSTIPPSAEVAASVGVRPTAKGASKGMWKRAWRVHATALPLLHALDSCRPRDSCLSLRCLWLKALSGNDRSSPAFDGGLSYDLLPGGTRLLVGRALRRAYPRLHHANIEIRTAYLDGVVSDAASRAREGGNRVRLVSLGAGYDPRSVKLKSRGVVDDAIELDLPGVIEVKRRQLDRLLRRRSEDLSREDLPELFPVDLNRVGDVKRILEDVLTRNNSDGDENLGGRWHTIFVFEGVLIYLDDGVPSDLLGACSAALRGGKMSVGSLCFADRLENVPGGDQIAGREELGGNGWELRDWRPKPGLARHMGSAALSVQGARKGLQ